MFTSIRHRAFAMVASIIASIAVIIAGAIFAQMQYQDGLETTNTELLPLAEALGEVEASMSVAHAESMRLILLHMSGVKGEPIERQAERTNLATTRALEALRSAKFIGPGASGDDGDRGEQSPATQLLERYVRQQEAALNMAAIDPSSGRLLYTAADNTFAELISELQGLADTARTNATSIGRDVQARGERVALYFTLAALVGSAIAIFILRSILQAIVAPLIEMKSAMQRLSDNDLDVVIAHHDRRDEIGAMANAMEVFRHNAKERQRLVAETAKLAAEAAERREAEKLAQERARAEEKRLQMTAQLKEEFGVVIQDAYAGNFARRIETHFTDDNISALSKDINILVRTVEKGVSAVQRAMRALAKGDPLPHDGATFTGAFADMMENIKETSLQISAQAKHLRHTALHDALTGLPNRRYLEQFLAQEKTLASKRNRAFGLLHIDLDRFKQINDTLGHAAGDDLLQRAAGVLTSASDDNDFVARVGGDEFVVFCARDNASTGQDTPLEQYAETVAGRIVDKMQEPIQFDGKEIRSGASVGLAFSTSAEFEPTEMMINADLALYEAKNAGRGRVHIFTPELHSSAIERKHMADDILRALETEEFLPFFQPQIFSKTGAIAGFEALARWQHPEKGLLFPSDFLPVAEEIGAISRIDQMIARKSVEAVRRMREEHGIDVPKLSLNFSFARLKDDGVFAELERIKPSDFTVCIELLESVFFDGLTDQEAWIIDSISEAGFEIEIDDFGSGHASVSGLMRLRPDRLKIDRSIVAPLIESPEQGRLVEAIIEMAQALEIGVIAEGIETMEHAQIVMRLGCPILQGYAFAKPLPEAEAVSFCQTTTRLRVA